MARNRRRSVLVPRRAEDALRTLRGVVSGAVAIGLTLVDAGRALAESPSPTGVAVGDPRSSGGGPGLVGDPMMAIVFVAAIALASLILTLVYVRATGGAGGSDTSR